MDAGARLEPESVDVLRIARAGRVPQRRPRAKEAQYTDELLAVEPEDRVGHMLRGNLAGRGNVYTGGSAPRGSDPARPERPRAGDVVRHNRTLTHWLQWPIYPIQRFGPIKVWGAYLVLLADHLAMLGMRY